MWCPLFLVLFAGAASAEHFHAWKTDTEYEYAVRGRTFSALHDVADQYSGIVMRAHLTVQPKGDGTLEAKVWKAQYAQVHTNLPGGWSSEIPDNMLEYKQFPMSEKVFEVKMRHGVVRDLIVDKDVPTWEVNVLKSIVSQLQVDTQGENLMASRYNQEPEDNRVNAVYKTMEDSVSGRCEVLYDMSPLPEYVLHRRPELMPLPEARGDGEIIDIVKTKNYSNCEQRPSYHFGITGSNSGKISTSEYGDFALRSSVSRVIITGDLKTFTIQSSVTTNKVIISPNFHENSKGMVSSRVNVTLVKMGPPSSGAWSTPANPESTGNLVYSYNNPFAGADEVRRAGHPTEDRNSEEQYRNRYNRYWRKKAQQKQDNDESDSSDSSKSANSLESKEEQWYFQPKPTLNEPPAIPLLPFFIGYQGKSINKAEQVDPVMAAKTLCSQIGSDFQNPNSITEEQTLEKFSYLARVLRTMNPQQILEAERELYQSANEIDPHDESQSVSRSTWFAFRDAVAQAGTGPALVTIKRWIKERMIRGFEAASVVAVLSKTARTPTPEYLDAFFNMATMPETTEEQYLNSSAMISFAELLRYSQADHHSSHTRYPVYTFGLFSPKYNPAILRDYVPYMAEQLKKAIENREYTKAHTFMYALGNTAHPKILSIFEPYLEGKKPASTFQRLAMVGALNKLAAFKPRLARGIFYRIYQNTGEAHQLRCAAVSALMQTNPPASMLQRMAEFTNDDHSKHVNAAVKSAIESASELEAPEWRELVKNARSARPLLNKEYYGFEYSKNYLTDYIDKEMMLAYHVRSGYISSDDSYIAEVYYATMQAVLGGLKLPKIHAAGMMSSVKDLYDMFDRHFMGYKKSDKSSESEYSPEKIAEYLKIEVEPHESWEAGIQIRSPYDNKFMSFDKYTLQRFPEYVRKAAAALKHGYNFNFAKIESADLTVSFPMESGFPFVYTLKVPAMMKMSGSAKGDYSQEVFKGSVDLRAVYSVQFQTRLGFVTPFEHQHYMAGMNKNYQIYIPIRAQVSYETAEKRVTFKLQPIEQNEKYKLMHHSVVPFTSRHDILSMSPVTNYEGTHKLIKQDPWKKHINFGSRTHGIYFKLESESASTPWFDNDETKWNWSPLKHLVFLFAEKPEYHKVDLYMEPKLSSDQSIILTGSFETLHEDTTKYDEDRSKDVSAKAPQVENKKQNDSTRRRQFLHDAAKGIAAADAIAFDVGLEYPGQEPFQSFATLAFATSKVDEKSRGLAYWRTSDAGNNLEFETCAGLEFRSPRSYNYNNYMSDKYEYESRKFDIDLRVGKTCESGYHVEIKGTQEQSKKYRDAVKHLPKVVECFRAAKKGVKYSPTCYSASVKMATMDKTHVTVKYSEEASLLQEVLDSYWGLLSDYSDDFKSAIKMEVYDESTNKHFIDMYMNLSRNDDKASFTYQSDNVRLTAEDVEIDPIVTLATNVHPDLSTADQINMDLNGAPTHRHMCLLESNWATTFDESRYPIHLGKCWHVAMTTYPRTYKDSGDTEKINEDMALSILVRDIGNDNKDVKFTLGDKVVEFSYTDSGNMVTVDGQYVNLSEKRSYRYKYGHDIEFEVYQHSDGSLRLYSSKYDIDALYDGQRVQIQASGKYRNDVRGLCGNYDGEPANDFTSPKDCVLTKPEEFVASYALTRNYCDGPATAYARKAHEAVCSRKSPRPGNVVTDYEAGRSSSEKSSWGYHSRHHSENYQGSHPSGHDKHCAMHRTKVIEEDNQICFSKRPVPTCGSGCQATRTKPKATSMYCMAKGPASQRMAERIKQGANPDLSQKESTKKSTFDIPMSCHSA